MKQNRAAIQPSKQPSFPVYRILAIVVIACILMALADGFLTNYVSKSFVKIILFTLLPYMFFFRLQGWPKYFAFPSNKQLYVSLLLGMSVLGLILSAYFILGPRFNFTMVASALKNNVGVTAENFLFISLYISVVNSFLEEFFFRGFAFLTLKQYFNNKLTTIISAVIFALYHIAIMRGWFGMPLFALLLLGLFVAGLLFNYIDEKTNTILTSWCIHMFANIAINIIGFILLGMI